MIPFILVPRFVRYLDRRFIYRTSFSEHGLILVAPGYLMYSRRYVVMPASLDMALFSFFLYAFYHCPILQILALRTASVTVLIVLPQPILRLHFHLHALLISIIGTILITCWFLHLVSGLLTWSLTWPLAA